MVQYMLGSLSALGEEVMPVLQSLIKHGGFYGPHMLATTTTFFNKQVPAAQTLQGLPQHYPKPVTRLQQATSRWRQLADANRQA